MSIPEGVDGPFPFSQTDLEAGNLAAGVRHTLAHFQQWRDSNPALIAEHLERYTRQLEDIESAGRMPAVVTRRMLPRRRRADEYLRVAREVNYFAVYNLGEVPQPETVSQIIDEFQGVVPSVSRVVRSIGPGAGVAGVLDSLKAHLPVLRSVPELAWLGERLERLFRILPESVVQAGGMGKVIRATAGVLAIAAFEAIGETPAGRAAHLAKVLPGAYALGAAYVIVDDTLQDLPGDFISPSDKDWCHQAIGHGLSTGKPIDPSGMPDHPLAEELHELYELLLDSHPFDECRPLYHAAEAMYLAQHRDSVRTVEEVTPHGLADLYPDIFIKSGMSRVVANLLGRKHLSDDCFARCLNTIFLGQFKDDLRDREEDLQAGRVTPFTYPPERADVNPLYDLFAYDAYAVHEVFHGDPVATETLTYFGAVKVANYLSQDPRRADRLRRDYPVTAELARHLRAGSRLSSQTIARLEPADTRFKDHCRAALRDRDQTGVDARTFVADRLPYINDVTRRYFPEAGSTGLNQIVAYAMDAPGKRLRPALGLMLAEGLGVNNAAIEPFVVACELFHTASLVFDDLPAQDDAAVRRGRPTAHLVFDEGSVQLAAVSMISTGFGLLAKLSEVYPARQVTEVIAYVGTVLGPERLCRGQDLDLHLGKGDGPVSGPAILEMYELKTSTTIEAALVPLMMLENRPEAEVELVRRYARSAGIVFQIRDDILDLTSCTEQLGKDAGNDVGKVNIVRVYGLAEAERLMAANLADAIASCDRLPFDTRLLKGMVTHFATRKN